MRPSLDEDYIDRAYQLKRFFERTQDLERDLKRLRRYYAPQDPLGKQLISASNHLLDAGTALRAAASDEAFSSIVIDDST